MNGGYLVYVHTSPSNKRYVGLTMRESNKRWQNGRGYIGNEKFSRAIKKYGWSNFKHEIVKDGLTQDEAIELEKALIAKYDAINNGYNQSPGGEIPMLCPSARRKAKEKLAVPVSQYTKDGVWITDYDSLTEAGNAVGVQYTGITGCLLGRLWSAGGYLWARKGEKPVMGKKMSKSQYHVVQLSMSDASAIATYRTVVEASKQTGISAASIYGACSELLTTAGGYYWVKEEQISEKLPLILEKIKAGNRQKHKVVCVTTGEVFDSLRAASNHYSASYGGIGQCCRGETKHSGTHPKTGQPLVWRYYES